MGQSSAWYSICGIAYAILCAGLAWSANVLIRALTGISTSLFKRSQFDFSNLTTKAVGGETLSCGFPSTPSISLVEPLTFSPHYHCVDGSFEIASASFLFALCIFSEFSFVRLNHSDAFCD